jgi:hypothetical protein
MKIRDIIVETKVDIDDNNDGIPDTHQSATPGLRSHHSLDNSSPYHPWRFAAHFLGGADGKNPYEHKPAKEGPNGQSLVTVSYTKEEDDMIDQAAREFGPEATNFIQLTPRGSTEVDSIHKVSPHRNPGPVTLKSKKKK